MSGKGVLRTSAPCLDGASLFGRLAEDKTKKHVETTDDKEKEGSHEGEVVDTLRKNRCADSMWK